MGHGIAAVALFCAGLWPRTWAAEVAAPLSEPQDKISYSVGFELGHYLAGLKRQGTGVELEAVFRGILDALSGNEPLMNKAEIRKQLDELKAAMSVGQDDEGREPAQPAPQARARGFVDDFAALNAKREGVKTTASGLQYKVNAPGTGRTPTVNDTVTVHYRGTLVDGTEFDSSYKRGQPATFPVGGVIAGWTEALQLMKEGAQYQLAIPATLAYGDRGPLAGQVLLFDVELISVSPAPQAK